MFTRSRMSFAAAIVLLVLASPAAAQTITEFKMLARLFGDPATTGKATYLEHARDGQLERRFKVVIEDGTPGQIMFITVNDFGVGFMQLDAFGRGVFVMRSAQFVNDPSDGVPMPNSFPIIFDEDVVAVGPLSGVFFDREFTRPGNENLVSSKYRLVGNLVGAITMNGAALYRERIKNGLLARRFLVVVNDAAPNATFNVVVHGLIVGQLTTNNFGAGEFEMRTAAFIDSPEDGIAMPDAFPSLLPGDFVAVGPLAGPLLVD